MSVVTFFFGNLWHFVALVIVLVVVFEGAKNIAGAWRRK